jgi:pimeloyl-ACP methyl ester carboxylesterase
MMLAFGSFRPRRVTLPVFSDAALRAIGVPLLAIVGTRDALLDSGETARRLEQCTPRASVVVLPEAGHLLRGQTMRVLEFLQR